VRTPVPHSGAASPCPITSCVHPTAQGMRYLFLLAVLLIGYGSLYPFEFRGEYLPFRVLFESRPASPGDVFQNFALFLPFGYLGMVAWRRPPRPLLFLILVASAAIYSTALQVAQLCVPGRDPSLRDVVLNALGAAAGALVGVMPLFDVRRIGARARAAPWVLIGLWLAYRLSPFAPSIDLQEWKESVKPLVAWRPFPWTGVLHDAAAWLGVACLWAAAPAGRFSVRWLWALALATLGLEVAIVDNVVFPANAVGALAGSALAACLGRRPAAVAALLAAAIAVTGLAPLGTGAPQGFQWVPFGGFLHGSMLVNAQNFFEKAFLYGTLVWLLREAGLGLAVATLGTSALLAGIEALQTRVAGHTPEVTDPLLALLAALFLAVADRPCPPEARNPLESGDERRKEDL